MHHNGNLPAPSHGGHTRVLHSIAPLKDWQRPADAGEPVMNIAVVDLETEGLDPRRDRILEFAGTMVEVDAAGRIVKALEPASAFADPGRPIDPRITKITGITDDLVAGQAISRRKLAAFLTSADVCLSFNAGFDRNFLEAFLPDLDPLPWICAMADVPWLDLGFDGRKQSHLLMQAGLFNPVAHRAKDDVESLVNLLAYEARDGRTIMAHALQNAREPSWRIEATDAPYRFKDELRRAGYRWSFRKVWHKLVRPVECDLEVAWYKETIGQEPTVVPVDWIQRYRADWTWMPASQQGGNGIQAAGNSSR